MKKAPAPTKAQGATDEGAGCSNLRVTTPGVKAALQTLSGWADFDPDRGAMLIGELREISESDLIIEPNAKALTSLIALMELQSAKGWEHDWQFLKKASDLLSSSIVEGLANGFGDFDACLRPNGTVAFIGEEGLVYAPLRWQQMEFVEKLSPRLPHVFFMNRSTGEILPVKGLMHAVELLAKARREALECFETNAWYARAKRRGEA